MPIASLKKLANPNGILILYVTGLFNAGFFICEVLSLIIRWQPPSNHLICFANESVDNKKSPS